MPASTTVKSAPKPRNKNSNPGIGFPQIALAFAGIIKEIGLPGFIVTFVCTIFYVSGTDTQKREFIDKFILLKGVSENPYPFGIIVIALIICSVIQHVYYSLRLKAAKEETQRSLDHNSDLQKRLLDLQIKPTQKVKP
jgi:hypothetical protein